MKIFIFYGNEIVEGSSASLFVDLLIEQLEKKPEIESVILRNANNTNLRFMNNWNAISNYEKDNPEYLEFERSGNLNHNNFRDALKSKLEQLKI